MIIGKLDDTAEVEKLHPLFASAFHWLRANWRDSHGYGVAQVEIEGRKVFANIDTATMKSPEEQILEVHRRYIDIHVPVSCDEIIGWRPVYGLESVIEPYTRQPDRAFYSDAPLHYFTIHPGEFAIMAPHDAHAPIIGSGTIDKICMKVRVVL
ncbi:MAG: YhcH/YjgK/YiaL family protein [Muribaculaceae bacterium]